VNVVKVINQLYPSSPEQMQKMFEPGPEGPIVMVNLLKFKDRASYKDGRETDLTGREAYEIYGAAVSEYITKFGGRILFAGDVTHLTIGEVDDLWDEVALAEYPNRAAMLAMSTSEEFAPLAAHREAGLEGQLNIETTYSASFPTPKA
jgi:uncharacterized protein (DUF1330 family)